MKSAVLYDYGKMKLRDMPKPECGDGDIIIKVKAAGICGGDLHYYKGTLKAGLGELPVILGHEFSGIIAEKGKNVDSYWNIGDRVVSENTGYACGRCPACQTGNFVSCSNRLTIGCSMNGGFSEYVKIPEQILRLYPNCIFKIPENIGFDEATVLEPASNAYKAVVQEGCIMPGDTMVVFGVGALGLMSIQHGKIAGAANIIAIGLSADKANRFELAKKYGATHCIAANEVDNVVSVVNELAGSNGVALTVDAAGAPICMKQAIEITRPIGHVVRIGMDERPYSEGLDIANVKSLTIRGHMGYNTVSWRQCIALAKAGILDLKSIISHHLPLEEYDLGFQLSIAQEATKVILEPEKTAERS